MTDEKPILCFLGWHRWGRPYDHTGGSKSNHPIGALFEAMFCPRKHKVKCERCGKVKEVYEK